MKKTTFKHKFFQHVVWLLIFIVLTQTSEAKETIFLSESTVYQHKIAVVTNRSVMQLNNDSILFESKPDESGHFSYLTASILKKHLSYIEQQTSYLPKIKKIKKNFFNRIRALYL